MLNIAVCGKFHYPRYLKALDSTGVLSRFYCSYKLGESFGLPSAKIRNSWMKEYAINLHLRILGYRGMDSMLSVYHRLWQNQIEKVFEPAQFNLFMIHGNCTRLINRARAERRVVIGEAVNAHPEYQNHLLSEEYKKRKMHFSRNRKVQDNMLEEFANVDRILVPSKFVADSFAVQGFKRSYIVVIPYGVEFLQSAKARPKSQDINAKKKTINVLCVGQIIPRKGQFYLLEALSILNRKPSGVRYNLTLVGRYNSQYLGRLRCLPMEFSYIDHIDNKIMPDFMSKFDVFVNPSIEDGFSVVICEALSAGLPVVTTTNNGAADIIRPNINGAIALPANSSSLAQAIEMAIEGGASGLAPRVQTWKDYADQLSGLCKDLGRSNSLDTELTQ